MVNAIPARNLSVLSLLSICPNQEPTGLPMYMVYNRRLSHEPTRPEIPQVSCTIMPLNGRAHVGL